MGGGFSYLRKVKSRSKSPRNSIGFLLSWLNFKRRPKAPTDTLLSWRRKPTLGEVKRSTTGTTQTIEVIITFREHNINAIELRVGTYQSSMKRNTLYFGYISCYVIWIKINYAVNKLFPGDAIWIQIVVYLIILESTNTECHLFLEQYLKMERLIVHNLCSTNLDLLNCEGAEFKQMIAF